MVYRYVGYPALRAGVLLCEQQCKDGVLDYRFDETLASSTDGPMVGCVTLILAFIVLYQFFLTPCCSFSVDCEVGREQQQV
jgi:hypothetical protein